jgi:hypothetical protein
VELADGVALALELLVLVLVLVQAARTLAESTATALMASAFFENQGRSGLTPGSSFRVVPDLSSGSSPLGMPVCSPSRVIPAESVFRLMNATKSIHFSRCAGRTRQAILTAPGSVSRGAGASFD